MWPVSEELSVNPVGNSSWKYKRRVVFTVVPSAITLFMLDKGTAQDSCQWGGKTNNNSAHIS